MPNNQLIDAMSVIAEPTRLRIMQIISAKGEICAKEILPEFNITQPTLSHHMNLLEESGLVVTRKDGRLVFYSVNKPTIAALSELIMSLNDQSKTIEAVKVEVKPKAKKPVKTEVIPEEPKKEKDKDKKKKKDKDKSDKKKKDKKKKK